MIKCINKLWLVHFCSNTRVSKCNSLINLSILDSQKDEIWKRKQWNLVIESSGYWPIMLQSWISDNCTFEKLGEREREIQYHNYNIMWILENALGCREGSTGLEPQQIRKASWKRGYQDWIFISKNFLGRREAKDTLALALFPLSCFSRPHFPQAGELYHWVAGIQRWLTFILIRN